MSGFQRGRSSIDSAIDMASSFGQHKEQKRITSLDIKGAFGNLTNDGIVPALENPGTCWWLHHGLVSYLTNCTFFVGTTDCKTASHEIISFVPYAGVLSQALFAIRLINLPTEIWRTVQISIYAGDLCLRASGNTRP